MSMLLHKPLNVFLNLLGFQRLVWNISIDLLVRGDDCILVVLNDWLYYSIYSTVLYTSIDPFSRDFLYECYTFKLCNNEMCLFY